MPPRTATSIRSSARPRPEPAARPRAAAAPREGQSREGQSREVVNSVLKALDVLAAFGRHKPRMTLSQVAGVTGMSRASARRLLITFATAGYMDSDGRHFHLTPKLLELGHAAMTPVSLWDVANPIIADLAQRLGESCFGAVLDGTDVHYVAHVDGSNRFVNVGIRVGSRLPAYCTSIGRVLLSGLDDGALDAYLAAIEPARLTAKTITSKTKLRVIVRETRRRGWAQVDEELEVGLRSISAPIRSRSGRIVAAINVCAPSVRVSPQEIRARILPELLAAAERVSNLVRGSDPGQFDLDSAAGSARTRS